MTIVKAISGQFLILSPLVNLSMEKTMVAMVISELESVSRLKLFPETGPWASTMMFSWLVTVTRSSCVKCVLYSTCTKFRAEPSKSRYMSLHAFD